MEDLSDGIAFCQLFDIIHPKNIGLNKLDYKGVYNSDHLRNIEHLGMAFRRVGI